MAMSKAESEAVWKLLQDLTDRIYELELLNDKYEEIFDEHYYLIHSFSRVLVNRVENIEIENCLRIAEIKKLNDKHKKLAKYLNFMKIVNDGIYHN